MTIHISTFCTAFKHECDYEFEFKHKHNKHNKKKDKDTFVEGESITEKDITKVDMEIIEEWEELYID